MNGVCSVFAHPDAAGPGGRINPDWAGIVERDEFAELEGRQRLVERAEVQTMASVDYLRASFVLFRWTPRYFMLEFPSSRAAYAGASLFHQSTMWNSVHGG